MPKTRRHERVSGKADLVLRPNAEARERFAGKTTNASKGGMAVFSNHALPPGKLLGLELIVPTDGEGIRRVVLFGVTRWMRVMPEGNMLGIELMEDQDAGDYEWFAKHFEVIRSSRAKRAEPSGKKRGFTLVELSIAMVIICLMMTLAAPIFTHAIEHSRLDTAVANLRAVWAAQRVYWLEERTFSPELSNLLSMDLVDSAIAASASDPSAIYAYDIFSADESEFVCRAARNGSRVWTGTITLDEEGTLGGTITSTDGTVLTPQ
jgi:prepilin-type N-terminal cleavage/methylation domain-containing protein